MTIRGSRRRWPAIAWVAVLLAGCAPPPLVVRAIRARGGPLPSLVRQVEADVHLGFPGCWRWRAAFLVPDHYAMTIYATAEPDHYVFDGTRMRAFVGAREVASETGIASPLRSHARFTAVVNLDVLLLPGVRVVRGPGAGEATAVFADDGSRYRLLFDDAGRLVRAVGPIVLDPFGRGDLTAVFSDFRWTAGVLLPYRADYRLGGRALAEERTLRACPGGAAVTAEAFASPWTLPDCPAAQDSVAVCR